MTWGSKRSDYIFEVGQFITFFGSKVMKKVCILKLLNNSTLDYTRPILAYYVLSDARNKSSDLAFEFPHDQNISTCPGCKFVTNSLKTCEVSRACQSENLKVTYQRTL